MAEPWEHHLSSDKQTLRVPKAESYCEMTVDKSLQVIFLFNKIAATNYSYIKLHKSIKLFKRSWKNCCLHIF